jgi:hypothetical protein
MVGMAPLIVQGGEEPHDAAPHHGEVWIGVEGGALPDAEHGGGWSGGNWSGGLPKDVLFCGVQA